MNLLAILADWRPSKRQTKALSGKVRIGENSSLRKLMRAAARGRIPDERQVIIDAAMQSAEKRREKYLSSHARAMDRLVQAIKARVA